MQSALYQIENPPDAWANAANLATKCSSITGSGCSISKPVDLNDSATAFANFGVPIRVGSQSANATSPDLSFRWSASASASACSLLSPSPSLYSHVLQLDVSCGHKEVTIFTSNGQCQIDARKYSPSGPVGLCPITSMPIS